MSLSYTTLRAIPHLPTYEAAATYESNIKPIRGCPNQTKPLGRRNQKDRSIKRLEDGSIVITHGWPSDETLRYYPGGTLHITYPAGSDASLNEVITRVTGIRVWTERGIWARTPSGTTSLRQRRYRGGQQVPGYEPNVFVKDPAGNWVADNPLTLTTHVVNRKGANAVRARYAAAISYIKALYKLRKDSPPTKEEAIEVFYDWFTSDAERENASNYGIWHLRRTLPTPGSYAFTSLNAKTFVNLLSSEDPGDHYKCYLWLWVSSGNHEASGGLEKALIQAHHDEWLVECAVPAGEKAHDRYAWAFR